MFKFVILFVLLAGSLALNLNSRVIGGFEPEPHQFPYLVSVIWEFPPLLSQRHVCGGVIVSPDWIVTAASCIEKYGKLSIKSGKHNLAVYEPSEEIREVQFSVIHKDYKKSSILNRIPKNNIAMLKLKFPLKLSSYSQAINFENTSDDNSGDVTLIGWGGKNDILPTPEAALAPLLPWDSCLEVLRISYKNIKLEDTNICTGPIGGTISACSEDIGGPLVKFNEQKQPQLVGIVSWTNKPCGKNGLPTVYTHVSNYVDWINDKLEASK